MDPAARIARLLNRGLAASTRARELCRALAGRRLRVALAGGGWSADLVAARTGDALECAIHATAASAEALPPADATVRGGPLALLGLLATDRRERLQRGDARIDGDAEVAAEFAELAALVRPDLEEELGRFIGRAPAHLMRVGAGTAFARARALSASAARNLAGYLAYEDRTLVPRTEAEHLLRGAESLRERVDRLGATLTDLETRTRHLTERGGLS